MMKSFGERLKAIREEKKITQAELAAKTGIKQSAISSYENDKYMPNIENLRAICNVLNVSAADLDTRFMELENLRPLIGNYASGDYPNQFNNTGKVIQHTTSRDIVKSAKRQLLTSLLGEVIKLSVDLEARLEFIKLLQAELDFLNKEDN
jgi:putative DNA-binding protein, XRE family